MHASDLLHQRIASITIGPPQHYQRLTVFPLSAPAVGEGYLPLAAALLDSTAEVCEQPAATVPSLRLTNHSARPVFILDGEEVVGGLQNRIVTSSALIAAKVTIDLPVSCVEHGRWHAPDKRFAPGETSHARLRALSHGAVSAGLQATGSRASDQGAIWEEVRHKARSLAAEAPTDALNDVYRSKAASLAQFEQALPLAPDACGLAIAIGGRVVALDLFNQPALAAAYWLRLVRGAALDALDHRGPDEPASLPSVAAVLDRGARATITNFPSLSLGLDARIIADGLLGAALIHADHIVHLAVFSRGNASGVRSSSRQQAGRIARPKRRATWLSAPDNHEPRPE